MELIVSLAAVLEAAGLFNNTAEITATAWGGDRGQWGLSNAQSDQANAVFYPEGKQNTNFPE